MEDKISTIYQYLSSQSVKNLPNTEEGFRTMMSDDVKAGKVHQYLLSQNIKNVDPDFGVFSDYIGIKKKVSSEDISEIIQGISKKPVEYSEVPSEESSVAPEKPQPPQDKESYVGDLLERIGAGAIDIATSTPKQLTFAQRILDVPRKIVQKELELIGMKKDKAEKVSQHIPFAKPPEINGVVNIASSVWDKIEKTEDFQNIEKKADELRQSSARYEESIKTYIQNKEYNKAVGASFLGAAESLPLTLGAMFGGGVGLGAIGSYSASAQYDELSANTDMKEYQKMSNALLNGGLEILTERLGSANYGKLIKSLYKTTGKEVAEEAVKKGVKSWLVTMWKKAGIYTNPVGEGLEEAVNQFGSNVTARITGEDPERPLDYGVVDAAASGAASGAVFTTVGLPGQIRQQAYEKKLKEQDKATLETTEAPPATTTEEAVEPTIETTATVETLEEKVVGKNGNTYTPEILIRKSGKDKVRVLDDKGSEVSSLTMNTVEVDGEKYWSVIQLATATGEENNGLATAVYRQALNNLPEGYKGIISPAESRINKTEIPKVHQKLAAEFDMEVKENGDMVFKTPQITPDIPSVSQGKTKSDTQVPPEGDVADTGAILEGADKAVEAPITVYRGMRSGIEEDGGYHAGKFVTSTKENAARYSPDVQEFTIPNNLNLLEYKSPEGDKIGREFLEELGPERGGVEKGGEIDSDDMSMIFTGESEEVWVDFLTKKGYDGTYMINKSLVNKGGEPAIEYHIFDKSLIKPTPTRAETAQVKAEPLKEGAEIKAMPLKQRDRVRQEILSVGANVTPEQADAALAVFDAQAKVFAQTLGKTEEDYYATIDVEGEAKASVLARQAQMAGRTIKGQYQDIGGRDVVTLMKKGDVSTLLHEVAGHRGRKLLGELAAADKTWAGKLKEVEKWAGVKNGKWHVGAEEKFARAFEGYVRNGKLPKSAPQALKEAFDKLKEWMKAIYKDPKVFEALDPKIKSTFDALLGMETKPAKETKKAAPKKEITYEMGGDALFQSVENEMSLTEGEKIFGRYSNVDFENLDNILKEIEAINQSEANKSFWDNIYKSAGVISGASKLTELKTSGKLKDIMVVKLSENCERLRWLNRAKDQNLVPDSFPDLDCYGSCWTNRKTYGGIQLGIGKEGYVPMEKRGINLATKESIDKFFSKPENVAKLKSSKKFLRHGQVGDDSHLFATGIAEHWLKKCKEFGVKQTNVFISASYAPVTKEQYEALLPYKDLFIIHFSNSGWFSQGEILNRYNEFRKAEAAGIPVAMRVVTNDTGVKSGATPEARLAEAPMTMKNDAFLFGLLNKIIPLEKREYYVLETQYHNDYIKHNSKVEIRRSEPSKSLEEALKTETTKCCSTGTCITCRAKGGCMTDIVKKIYGEVTPTTNAKLKLGIAPEAEGALFQEEINTPYEEFSDAMAIKAEKDALNAFPTTEDWKVTGWLTISGNKLDFSGNDRGAWGNSRNLDHREVNDFMGEYNLGKYDTESQWVGSNSTGMLAFMDMGNIRVSPESRGMAMHTMPSNEQFREIRNFINKYNGEIILDLNNNSVEYPKWTDEQKIIDDIKNFYREGIVPEAGDELYQEANASKEERRKAKLNDAIKKVKKADPKLSGKALQDAIMKEFLSEDIPEGREKVAERWVKSSRKYRAMTPKKVRYRGVDVRSLREPSEATEETDAMVTLRDRIDATREKYETKAMQTTIDEAMSVIEGYGDIETAFKTLSKTSGLPPKLTEDVIQGARLILLNHYSERLANNADDTNAYESIDSLLEAIRKQSTDYGRAGNILRAWGMFQPAGLLNFMKGMQKKHNAVVAAQPSKINGKTIGEVLDEMNKELGGEVKDAVTVTISSTTFENLVKKARPKTGAASIKKDREALREKWRNMPLMQTEGFTSNERAMLIDFLDTYITKGGVRKLSEAKVLLEEDMDALGVALENLDEAFDIEFKDGVSYRQHLGKLEAQKSIDKAIREVVKDHFENPQSRRQTLAERLTWETGINDADAQAIEKVVTAEFDKKLDAAAKKYMTRMWGSDRVPQDRQARTILDKLRTAIRAGAMTDEFFRNLFAAKFGFVEITEEQGKELVTLQGIIDEYKGTYWEADATRHLLRIMSAMYPQDAPNRFMETWVELIYASMLSGISTSVVNLGTVGSNYLTKQIEDAFNFSKVITDIKQGKWNADVITNLYGMAATFGRLSRGAKQYLDTMRKGGFGDKYTIEAVSRNKVHVGNLENMKKWKVFGREIPNLVSWAKYSGRNLFGQDKMTTAMFEDHYLMKLLIDYQAEITGLKGTKLTKVVMNLYRNAFLDQSILVDQIEKEAAEYSKKSGLSVTETQRKIRLYELQRQKMFQDLLKETNVAKAKEAMVGANELARTSVFTMDRGGVIASTAYAIGNATAKLMEKNIGGKAAAMAIKVFIPFTRIVGNVAEYMLDYTPVYGFARANDFSISGLSKKYLGKSTSATMEGDKQRMEQMGRAYFGTITFLALAALLLGNDEEDDVWIVGAQGKDFKAERDVKNYSINFRGKDGKVTSIPFMYMPALAIPLGLIGNLNDQIRMKETKDGKSIDMDTRPEELEDIFNRFSIGMLATAGTNTAFIVKDMSFVEGGAKLLELSTQVLTGQVLGTKSGVQYLTEEIIKRELGFLAKPLPQNTAFVQQAWKFFDPEQYSSKGIENAIKYSLGLQRIDPQYSYDVLGHIKKTYPGENQLLNYPNWFSMKEQYPNVEFLDKYNALPKMPVNRTTEIETEGGIDYRKLEPKEWEQYTLRAGQLFDKMITEYSADAENVAARYAEKKVGKDEVVTTGVQEDVAKMWSKAKTIAGSEITEWGVVKSDTALWSKMVEHEAVFPYSSSKTIDKERLNADELYRFNSIKAEEYAKLIKSYLTESTSEQIASDKKTLTTSKKSTRWDYKLQMYKEKADDRAESIYKREGKLGD